MQRPRTILLVVTFLAAMLAVDSDAFGQRGRSSGGGRSSVGRSSGRSSSSIGRSSGRSSASIGRSSSRSSGSRSISRPSSSSRSSSSRSSVSRPSSSSSSRGYSSRGYSPSRSSSGSNVRYITTPARSSSRSSSRPSSSSTYRSGEASIPNRTTTARSSSDYGGWRARPPAQPTTSTPIDRPNFVDLSGAGAQPRYRLPSFSGSVSRARTRTQPGTGPSASARARSRSRLSEPVDTSQTFRPRTVTRADILARYSGTPEARAVDARSALRLPMLSKTRRSPAAELPAGVIADRTQPRSGLPTPDAGRSIGVVTPARVDRANAGRRAGTRVASTPTPTDWAHSSRSDSAKRMRDLPRTNPERARNIRAAGAAITRAQDAGLRAGSRLLTGVGLSPSDLTRRSERGTDLATDRGRDAGGDYGGDVGGDGDYGGDGDGDWDHDHDHDHDHHAPDDWYWWWGYP